VVQMLEFQSLMCTICCPRAMCPTHSRQIKFLRLVLCFALFF